MPNACFRCKTPIDSGGTFCRSCRSVASLDVPYVRDTRLWVVIAVAPLLVLAAGAVGVAALVELVPASFAVVTILPWPLGLVFAYALYRDCQHVRRRDDTDWEPSEWVYAAFAFAAVFLVVPMLLIAPYHLYRRKGEIGLVFRSGDD